MNRYTVNQLLFTATNICDNKALTNLYENYHSWILQYVSRLIKVTVVSLHFGLSEKYFKVLNFLFVENLVPYPGLSLT